MKNIEKKLENVGASPLIEKGYLVKATSITDEPGQVYVYLTEIDGTEQLYKYVPEPDFVHVKFRSEPKC